MASFTEFMNLLLSKNWDNSKDIMTFVKLNMKIEFDTSNYFVFYIDDKRIKEVMVSSREDMVKFLEQNEKNVT